METLKCLRCGGNMYCLGSRQIQLGQGGFRLGELSTPPVGALDVDIWVCPPCGKLEFYQQGSFKMKEKGPVPQVICPGCGARHDLYAPACPECGYKNLNIK